MAHITLSELAIKADDKLSDATQSRLIEAYLFLFNERFTSLFDRCHDALWKTFAAQKDTGNLLGLFRHSSLFWRLRGQEDREKKYLRDLAKSFGNALTQDVRTVDREVAYYLVRASSILVAK